VDFPPCWPFFNDFVDGFDRSRKCEFLAAKSLPCTWISRERTLSKSLVDCCISLLDHSESVGECLETSSTRSMI
jgi:hypothetical protein